MSFEILEAQGHKNSFSWPSFIMINLFTFALISCSSSQERRIKISDKNMRIMIDPDSFNEENFVGLQIELVRSNVWTIIDRGAGFRAIVKEQERQHRSTSGRYNDREKFAHWGKLYGAGAIITGHVQCSYRNCVQILNLIDANTGEHIISVDEKQKNPSPNPLSWEEIVEELVEIYPKYFTSSEISKRLMRYKKESREHSLRKKGI